MLHVELLIWVDTVVLIHHLVVETSVETIVLQALVLLVLVVLIYIASHYCWVIIIKNVLLERSGGAAFDFRSFDFLGVVGAIAAVSCTTSHFLTIPIL